MSGASLDFVSTVRSEVEARMRKLLQERGDARAQLSRAPSMLVDTVTEFSLRGGKRLRPALVYATFADCGGDLNNPAYLNAVYWVGVYLELLQSYLLIHDDWMDGDVERRGGPTAHIALRTRLADIGKAQHAESLAILCGDLASGYAREALRIAMTFTPTHALSVLSVADTLEQEVVLGQELDILENAPWQDVFRLKTGSYTVAGPMRFGACLAPAPEYVVQGLDEVAHTLGLAFQLRDDALGVFGDQKKTGKPVGRDLLRASNSVLDFARTSHDDASLAPAVAAIQRAREGDLAALEDAVKLLKSLGVSDGFEANVRSLADSARSALEKLLSGPFRFPHLNAMIELIVQRES